MEKLANAITDYYVQKKVIDEGKREIYCYGFKLIIADIINYIIIIVSGVLLGIVLESIIFLISLCGIRQFCGGFHAKTFWLCRLSMITTYLCVMLLSGIISEMSFKAILLLVINVTCVIFISIFAPVEHRNKPLSANQKHNNKIKSIITSVILSLVSMLLLFYDIKMGVTISITLLAVIILMIISMAEKKGGKNDVQLD